MSLAVLLGGCGQTGALAPTPDQTDGSDERAAQGIAEAALGKGSEVLAQGDLPQDGRVQMLVVNRAAKSGANAAGERGPIRVTRAAILQQDDGNWSVVLLCDEHVKNAGGYLGGTAAARAEGWNLQYLRDPKDGLELTLIPGGGAGNADQTSGANRAALDVRWNKKAKRYQTFDKTHERFLAEIPTLETPQSTLR